MGGAHEINSSALFFAAILQSRFVRVDALNSQKH